MKVRRFFCVVAAASFAACALLAEGPQNTVISVAVTSPYDKPVNNAAVILDFIGGPQWAKFGRHKRVHWEARTDSHGIAKFPPVPQGTLQLQIVAKSYQTFGNKYDIDTPEKNIDVKLKRPQDQYSAHPPLKPADEPPAQPQTADPKN